MSSSSLFDEPLDSIEDSYVYDSLFWVGCIVLCFFMSRMIPSGLSRRLAYSVTGALLLLFLRSLSERYVLIYSNVRQFVMENQQSITIAILVVVAFNFVFFRRMFGQQASQASNNLNEQRAADAEEEQIDRKKLNFLIGYGITGLVISLLFFMYILFSFFTSQIPNLRVSQSVFGGGTGDGGK